MQSHMWFNLAASQPDKTDDTMFSDELAIRMRDGMTEQMTPADISKAQKMAREWEPSTASQAVIRDRQMTSQIGIPQFQWREPST